MELGLAGRAAAVAGASSGLGLATAHALVAEGARVVICGRHAERVDAAVAALRAGGGDAHGIVADVGATEGATGFVEQAVDRIGPLDILVANAGGPPAGTFASTTLDGYESALRLNLLSTVAMCRAAVPGMVERRWGRVVAITSLTVRQPSASLILSNTARAGVTGFLKTLATEVAPHGVTVNSVQPGSHDTERLRELYGGDTSGSVATVPMRRLGTPDEFAAVVTFLCSVPAAFVTGVALQVDGGAYAGLL